MLFFLYLVESPLCKNGKSRIRRKTTKNMGTFWMNWKRHLTVLLRKRTKVLPKLILTIQPMLFLQWTLMTMLWRQQLMLEIARQNRWSSAIPVTANASNPLSTPHVGMWVVTIASSNTTKLSSAEHGMTFQGKTWLQPAKNARSTWPALSKCCQTGACVAASWKRPKLKQKGSLPDQVNNNCN